jgi:hypothetical protein
LRPQASLQANTTGWAPGVADGISGALGKRGGSEVIRPPSPLDPRPPGGTAACHDTTPARPSTAPAGMTATTSAPACYAPRTRLWRSPRAGPLAGRSNALRYHVLIEFQWSEYQSPAQRSGAAYMRRRNGAGAWGWIARAAGWKPRAGFWRAGRARSEASAWRGAGEA